MLSELGAKELKAFIACAVGITLLAAVFIAFVPVHAASLVTQLPNGSYQVPDNWKGCFVNPDDLNDTTFGCSGPVGGPDDYKNRPNASTIIINLSNGTEKTFDINSTGIYQK